MKYGFRSTSASSYPETVNKFSILSYCLQKDGWLLVMGKTEYTMTKRTHLLTTKLPKTYEELEIQPPHCNSNLTTNYSNFHDENKALTLSDFAKQKNCDWLIPCSYVVNVSCKLQVLFCFVFSVFFNSLLRNYVPLYNFDSVIWIKQLSKKKWRKPKKSTFDATADWAVVLLSHPSSHPSCMDYLFFLTV